MKPLRDLHDSPFHVEAVWPCLGKRRLIVDNLGRNAALRKTSDSKEASVQNSCIRIYPLARKGSSPRLVRSYAEQSVLAMLLHAD